jgi:hypothetical protein
MPEGSAETIWNPNLAAPRRDTHAIASNPPSGVAAASLPSLRAEKVVLLDESFATLGPENLKHAVLATHDRAESVIVVTPV